MTEPGYTVYRLSLATVRARPGELIHRGGYCVISFQETVAGGINGANVFARFGDTSADAVKIGGPETWELDDLASQLYIENDSGAGELEIVVSPPSGVRRV